MAEGWYCKIADQELGPLSADQLRTLASQGRISPNDPVRREGMDSWAPAGRVKGLFPPSNASAKSLPRAEPLVAEPLSQPPSASQPSAQPQPPKAPPTARPVSSTESPSTTPAAIPVARLPAALNPFSIVTDDTSPLGARGQSDGPTKIAGKKNRQRNGMLAAAGAVLAVGLAVGGVALYLSANDDPAETSKQADEGGIPDDLVLTEDSVASANSSDVVPPSTMAASSTTGSGDSSHEDAWTDASTGSITRGDVTVRVKSAELGRPHLLRASGQGTLPPDTYLILRLELSTDAESGRRVYTGWGNGVPGTDLRDHRNRTYHQRSWLAQLVEIDGQVRDVSLEPGEPTDDVLVFGPWPEQPGRVEYLRLRLPAAAFGGQGSLRFEIPAEMIASTDESEPERPSHEDRETADGENPFKPVDTESVEQEEPEEEIPVPRDRIPISGLHDEATE